MSPMLKIASTWGASGAVQRRWAVCTACRSDGRWTWPGSKAAQPAAQQLARGGLARHGTTLAVERSTNALPTPSTNERHMKH